MQESQKALLKYLSDALVCSSSSGSSVKKGLAAGVKMDDVMRNMDESKKRNQLMEQLGVKQQSVRDRNGQ